MLSILCHPLEGLSFRRAAAEPGDGEASQGTLNSTSVEGAESGGGQAKLLESPQENSLLWTALTAVVMWVVHVRSSLMCTPRNLKEAAISTSNPLMYNRRELLTLQFLKSMTISLVLQTLRESLLSWHHVSRAQIPSL